MKKVQPHPSYYHRSESARAACWACSDPEKLQISDEDAQVGERLFQEGRQSISNKYRMLAKTDPPSFDSVVSVRLDVPSFAIDALRRAWQNAWDPKYAPDAHKKIIEVSTGVFRGYKLVQRADENKRFREILRQKRRLTRPHRKP